jgi:hypothetical protein
MNYEQGLDCHYSVLRSSFTVQLHRSLQDPVLLSMARRHVVVEIPQPKDKKQLSS